MRLSEFRGTKPNAENPTIWVDNGPEFVSRVLDHWAYLHGVVLDFSRPGKPTDNAFVESFNGRLRDECLNTHWFLNLADARGKIEAWRRDYNECHPHTSLGLRTPADEAMGISFWVDGILGESQRIALLGAIVAATVFDRPQRNILRIGSKCRESQKTRMLQGASGRTLSRRAGWCYILKKVPPAPSSESLYVDLGSNLST